MITLFLLACTPTAPTPAADPASVASSRLTGDTGAPAPTIPPASPSELAAAVQQDRYLDDLIGLAVPRAPGSAGWQAAQDTCAETLAAAGFDVTLHDFPTGTNVVGRMAGSASTGTVVLSAHYDSVAGCAGADDNASGVAGVLEAARVLGQGTYTHDLVVACWDQEETGLRGSRAWVEQLDEPIALAVSFEMIGYASSEPNSQSLPFLFDLVFPAAAAEVAANDHRGDFITFVGDRDTSGARDGFLAHAATYDLPVIDVLLGPQQVSNPFLGDLQRSDHGSFWDAGHPAVMLTDSAEYRNDRYHCAGGPDSVDRLDHAFATAVIGATVGMAVELLELVQ